jgi:uncharacterized protein YhbP (UPF0306 family)
MEAYLQSAREIIEKIEYFNIASITPEGLPWNTPVFFSYDQDLNFYWLSWKNTQHSANVENNPNVFITIYNSMVPVGSGNGVYMKGIAQELTNPVEIATGLKCHYSRSKHKMKDIVMFLTSYPRRVYKFVPEKVFFNGQRDIEGNYIDSRTELSLEELKKMLQKPE